MGDPGVAQLISFWYPAVEEEKETVYKEYTFVFPEFERIEEGEHKLKLTRLNFDREQPYHTDLLTISNIALTGDEENWRDIWKKWKDAFSVEKVTDRFFEDYKNAFFANLGKHLRNRRYRLRASMTFPAVP